MTKKPAIFIDRDGTLNEEVDHLHRPDEAVLTREAGRAIAELNVQGIPVLIVTNQGGIGTGKFGWKDFDAVMVRLGELLSVDGAHIDGAYVCPFHPEASDDYRHKDHPERKPNPGMLLRAAKEHGIDLSRSWMIGDKGIDLEAGRNAGCRVVLVRTGHGGKVDPALADFVAEDLAMAIDQILATWS